MSEMQDFRKHKFIAVAVCLLLLVVAITAVFQPETYSQFTSSVVGESTATVATPIMVVTPALNGQIRFESSEIGTYRFSVSNKSGSVVTGTKYTYQVKVTTPENCVVTPSSFYSSASSAYTNNTLLLSEGTYADGAYWYYVSGKMSMGLNSSTKYFVLNFTPNATGTSDVIIEVILTQTN